jgi:hypothetical protein
MMRSERGAVVANGRMFATALEVLACPSHIHGDTSSSMTWSAPVFDLAVNVNGRS